jgi:uncharacterized protein YdeI (YjbR/CyaY-like superfamily)
MAKPLEHAEQIEVKNRAELRHWLSENHTRKQGVWLVSYRKHTEYYLTYDDLVEECLCFGWVDSLPRGLDSDRTMLYISPRKKSSNWSKVNKERVEKLITSGLMTEAGLSKIKAAKQDGSWIFLDDVEAGILPDDLIAALESKPGAMTNFEAFPRSTKRGILEWIKNAKKPETRAKRIQDTAEKAALNIRANQ